MFLFSSIHFQCLYRPDAQSISLTSAFSPTCTRHCRLMYPAGVSLAVRIASEKPADVSPLAASAARRRLAPTTCFACKQFLSCFLVLGEICGVVFPFLLNTFLAENWRARSVVRPIMILFLSPEPHPRPSRRLLGSSAGISAPRGRCRASVNLARFKPAGKHPYFSRKRA